MRNRFFWYEVALAIVTGLTLLTITAWWMKIIYIVAIWFAAFFAGRIWEMEQK